MQSRLVAISFLLLGFPVSPLRAEWRVESSKARQGTGVVYIEKKLGSDSGSRVVRLVLIDSRECTLRVVDNPGGARRLDAAMEGAGCLAGVNGGYFHADFTPVGLVLANGLQIHPKESGKLISGLVAVSKGRVALLRTGEFAAGSAVTEALQSGPFLIDHGAPVAGLNASKRADRTVVISDGKGGCALLMAESVSLAEMARILATPGIVQEMKIVRALNLDGGSSSGLWVREPAVYERELKRVRNFLGVVKRP